ncbi:hypothetical protein ACFQ9X_55340 [Catenulispora yoronensis]
MATATLRMKADLPGDERDLVASGEIGSWLGFRHSSRVEIIGGDVFVSWAAGLTAGQTFSKILTALVNSRGDGCPRDVRMLVDGDVDFAVVEVERWAESMARFTSPWLGELVAIEVTTPDAGTGRGPGRCGAGPTRRGPSWPGWGCPATSWWTARRTWPRPTCSRSRTWRRAGSRGPTPSRSERRSGCRSRSA